MKKITYHNGHEPVVRPAGVMWAEQASTPLEGLAFAMGKVTTQGIVRACIEIDPQLLAEKGRDLVASSPFINDIGEVALGAAWARLNIAAVNDPVLGRHSTTHILMGGNVRLKEGIEQIGIGYRYSIDTNEQLEPDPATKEPPTNVIRHHVGVFAKGHQDRDEIAELLVDRLAMESGVYGPVVDGVQTFAHDPTYDFGSYLEVIALANVAKALLPNSER